MINVVLYAPAGTNLVVEVPAIDYEYVMPRRPPCDLRKPWRDTDAWVVFELDRYRYRWNGEYLEGLPVFTLDGAKP